MKWILADGSEYEEDRIQTNDVETLINGFIKYFAELTQTADINTENIK